MVSWKILNNGNIKKLTEDDIKYFISNKTKFIGATRTANYALDIPELDYLNMYYKNNVRSDEINDFYLNLIFDAGNIFESKIYETIKSKFGKKYVFIDRKIDPETNINMTLQNIYNGTPIIAQSLLFNPNNHSYGYSDLIVRSDYVNKLVEHDVLTSDEEKIKAPYLNGKYHYVVVEIKWSTLHLLVDQASISNVGRFSAYKAQLAIYNCALGNIQGYVPQYSYIIGKSQKINGKRSSDGLNCFERYGVVDYELRDINYINVAKLALDWIKDLIANGDKWDIYNPHRFELCVNMSSQYDGKWRSVKKEIAKKTNELTQIYYVGAKNRNQIYENLGVSSYKSNECTASAMGINGEKIQPIVDGIININNKTKKIKPFKIKNNMSNWRKPDDCDIFIDFETVSGFIQNVKKFDDEKSDDDKFHIDMDITNDCYNNDIIFMIGLYYKKDSEWIYKCIKQTDIPSYENEDIIILKLISFLKEHRGSSKPRLFHWGNAEESSIKSLNERHDNKFSYLTNSTWIDMCKIFTSEPIFIKGALSYKLKEITNAMYDNKMINIRWNSSIQDGLTALAYGLYYYVHKKYNIEKEDIINEIEEYNKVDCETLYHIISYIRKNN